MGSESFTEAKTDCAAGSAVDTAWFRQGRRQVREGTTLGSAEDGVGF